MPEAANPRDIVLLVDDSPEALGFLTEALEQSGFSVLIATSGNAALNIADRITPDLILLDAVMPGMDGFDTCARLKANASVAQVPVVFMTGLTETEHVVRALEAGGVDYLTKPINIDELRAASVSIFPMRARPRAPASRSMRPEGICLPCAATGRCAGRRRRRPASSTPRPAATTALRWWLPALPPGCGNAKAATSRAA